jgi:excinuclease ABC subunit C
LRTRQHVTGLRAEDTDIVVAVTSGGGVCVNLAMVRSGEHMGDKAMFPHHAQQATLEEILTSFLRQHYLRHPMPARIVCNVCLGDELDADLAIIARQQVPLQLPRGETQRAWVSQAEKNALLALSARGQTEGGQIVRLEALRELLGFADLPQRIECFDISHTQGERPVASCVVYRDRAMCRREYRHFNIRDVAAGDDYAAIRQAVARRYDGLDAGEGVRPDLILIDGGIGQLRVAADALTELGLPDLFLLGIAKGEGRKAGMEKLITLGRKEPIQLPADHAALHLLQEIRDEAHRFAVAGHRARRGKARRDSLLDGITGIGAKRRKSLIAHFGSLQGVREATVEQLATVPGVSLDLAEVIYRTLHT